MTQPIHPFPTRVCERSERCVYLTQDAHGNFICSIPNWKWTSVHPQPRPFSSRDISSRELHWAGKDRMTDTHIRTDQICNNYAGWTCESTHYMAVTYIRFQEARTNPERQKTDPVAWGLWDASQAAEEGRLQSGTSEFWGNEYVHYFDYGWWLHNVLSNCTL